MGRSRRRKQIQGRREGGTREVVDRKEVGYRHKSEGMK
jgi:hypothetical protein